MIRSAVAHCRPVRATCPASWTAMRVLRKCWSDCKAKRRRSHQDLSFFHHCHSLLKQKYESIALLSSWKSLPAAATEKD